MNPPGLAAILALTITACAAQQATVVVDGAAKGIPLPSTLHGIFFKELNRSGDGGLCAEMLADRSSKKTATSRDRTKAAA